MPDNPTEETVEIQWFYTPVDFFEEKVVRDCGDYTFEIAGGRITARMSAAFYKPGPDFQHALTEELRSYFSVWQLDRPAAFEIHEGGVDRLWPDGLIISTLAPQECFQAQTADQVDLVQMDSTGAIVRDTRRERIEAMKKRAEFRLRHASDPTTRRMLKGHAASLAKPDEELFCLYEIWDALMDKFGGRDNALNVLDISPETKTRFYDLTCNFPLRQGRQRGLHDTLRDATAEELDEARRIAQDMMERYWRYLDRNQQPT
jgi:hypothetical protein